MYREPRTDASRQPLVVMLGLFSTCQCWVTAVTVAGTGTVWLDLVARSSHRTTPLAVVSDIDTRDPSLTIETPHRHWAGEPEIRWHLLRQSAQLYNAYAVHRARPRPESEKS